MPSPPNKSPLATHPETGHYLILGNGSTIRKKARRDYDQASRKLDQARQDLARFKAEDLPAFDAWMNRTLGAEVTQINRLARLQQTKSQLIMEVELIACAKKISLAEAYQLALHQRAHPEEAPLPPKPDPAAAAEFAKFAQEYADRRRNNHPLGSGEPEPGVNKRVKHLYRILVRKLHPDSHGQMTPEKLECWHDVQEAYVAADLARLEHILALCELREELTSAHTSVTQLHRLTAQIKTSLRAVKRELTACRRQSAWNFAQCAERAPMEQRIRIQLEAEGSRLCEIIAAAEDLFRLWVREATSTKTGIPRRRQPGGKVRFENEEF